MTDVSRRLIMFIEHEKLNVAKFEHMLKLSNGFVRSTNERMTLTSQEKIENTFPHLNMNWVLTGEGDMLKEVVAEGQEDSSKTTYANISENHYIDRLLSTINRLVEQNSIYAEANKLNAEANNRNSKSIESLIQIIQQLNKGAGIAIK